MLTCERKASAASSERPAILMPVAAGEYPERRGRERDQRSGLPERVREIRVADDAVTNGHDAEQQNRERAGAPVAQTRAIMT